MNKKISLGVLAALVIAVVAALASGHRSKPVAEQPAPQIVHPDPYLTDPLNATYVIEGEPMPLMGGKAESIDFPGSTTKTVTKVFGTPVSGDLNNDGNADTALILTQNSGGSGTFYYIAAAIYTSGGMKGTNAVLLGDRIAPQTLEIKNGQIIANYADRKPGQPMSTTPSVGVSKYFVYDGSMLVAAAPAARGGEHCGGNMATARKCAADYHCAPDPNSRLPFGDVGGTCVAN